MAITYKILGQVSPLSGAYSTLYVTPSATSTVCSTLCIASLGVATNYSILVRPASAAIENKQYIAFNATIDTNNTAFLTLGITLSATDVITVYAGASGLSFNLFGSEIT